MNFRRLYNKLSRTYDKRHSSPTTRIIREKEVLIVKKFASGKTLDLGCGTGFHLPLVKDVIGTDISEGMLSRVKSEKPVMQAKCEKLPFRNNSFDTVLCMFSVLNVCKHGITVKEMGRVLKPGGRAILSVASIWDWDYESLKDKKEDNVTEEMRTKRFQISGEYTELRLFAKDELIDIFSKNGMGMEYFDSVFIFQRPKWGDLTPFTFSEKSRMWKEKLNSKDKDYGCIYFMVFKKS